MADFEEVVSEWAKRENTTPDNIKKNRACLLDTLPQGTLWFKATMQKEVLGSLKVIKSDFSWEIVSDRTGEISRIAHNLDKFCQSPPNLENGKKLMPDGSGRTCQQYLDDRIRNLQKFRKGSGNEGHNLTLILISTTKKGPFTILEGNHTAVSLYCRYFIDHPKLAYPNHVSYVGVSTSMNNCLWYRGS